MRKLSKIPPIWGIVVLWFVFCIPFFFQGKTPYPSTYQVNFFSPWSAYSQFSSPVKNNAQPDIISQIYPWRYLVIQEIKNGQLPLWNPYSFSGTPLLANYQSGTLNPLNLLFLLPIPFIDVWSFLVLLQPLLAGVFMYLFIRSLGISKPGSLVSSISFMFCGFITTWMGYGTLGFAILPLPLVLFAIEKYRATKFFRYLVLLSLSFAFSFFAGHFQTSVYLMLAVLLYIAYNVIFFKNKRSALLCFLFVMFGILLAMPQILPTFEFYTQSLRSALFQKLEVIPWNYLPTIFAPDFYGNPVTRNDWFGHYAEWNAYSGTIALMLSIFAIFFKRTKRSTFFIILGILSILMSYNTPLINLIVSLKIPVLSTSAFSRIIVLFSFSTAVLAGFGLDALKESVSKNRRSIIVWIIVIFTFLLGLAIATFSLPVNFQEVARKNLILPFAFIVLLLFGATLILKFTNKKYTLFFLSLIVILSAVEMYRFATKWQAFDPKDLVYSPVAITKFFNKNSEGQRFFDDSGAVVSNYYDIPTADGYDPLYIKRYGEFIKSIETGKVSESPRSVVAFPKRGEYTSKTINLLGMKYFVRKISDGEASWAFPYSKYPASQFTKVFDDGIYQVFKNNFSYPRVFLVQNAKDLQDKQKEIDYMFSNNLRENAVVEKNINLDKTSTGSAKVIKYTPNKITIDANSTGRALLVLTDNFYPGWHVTINGTSADILRTDYAFRGVVVPKGKSVIEFYFLPRSFLIGIYLSLIGILGIAVVYLYGYFRKI